MKLYIIAYVFGEVAMVVGPVPYNRTECESRIASMELIKIEKFHGMPDNRFYVEELKKYAYVNDIHYQCLSTNNPPKIHKYIH